MTSPLPSSTGVYKHNSTAEVSLHGLSTGTCHNGDVMLSRSTSSRLSQIDDNLTAHEILDVNNSLAAIGSTRSLYDSVNKAGSFAMPPPLYLPNQWPCFKCKKRIQLPGMQEFRSLETECRHPPTQCILRSASKVYKNV